MKCDRHVFETCWQLYLNESGFLKEINIVEELQSFFGKFWTIISTQFLRPSPLLQLLSKFYLPEKCYNTKYDIKALEDEPITELLA